MHGQFPLSFKFETSLGKSDPKAFFLDRLQQSRAKLPMHIKTASNNPLGDHVDRNGIQLIHINSPSALVLWCSVFNSFRISSYPFTQTTCFNVCTTSTRSDCAAITASIFL